ncbi:AtpZ/AtpI family protein [Antarcticibacterium sp. 1MA-6-2]|uniref:AtpZ/AtpI family protein n=1 Tax=Antarcticibacterium sp. 1MA-6-2 TaxID=2908210 RepID=UPI001F414349|nr:AtpZ/AtpI family protein [Antarcticibacterium sp. 1MA-6-2]UJH90230.1 AtpZ/AtpI family protein [Antarcticibacterium sp. 1MA-6-2]
MAQNKKNAPPDKYLEFVNIAIQMGIIIAAGVFIGIWLDKKYPNEYSGFTIGISLLGVFIALYQVIRKVTQMSKDD